MHLKGIPWWYISEKELLCDVLWALCCTLYDYKEHNGNPLDICRTEVEIAECFKKILELDEDFNKLKSK